MLVSNGDKSDSAYSDTRFGIRFSLGDMKWHAVNLDDRKMQISGEDDLIKRVLDTKEAKNFKKKCLDAWDKLFKGGKSPIIYIL